MNHVLPFLLRLIAATVVIAAVSVGLALMLVVYVIHEVIALPFRVWHVERTPPDETRLGRVPRPAERPAPPPQPDSEQPWLHGSL